MHAVNILVLALGAAAAAAQAPEGDAAPFDVELRTSVLVRGVDVTIGELADITPASTDSLAVSAVRFGPAPVPGFARTVTRTEVLQSLVAAGYAAGSFRFRGAADALMQAVTVPVSPAELIDSASTVLKAVLASEGGDVEWEAAGSVRNVLAPPGRHSRDLRARVRG
jgi:hypothetical protein